MCSLDGGDHVTPVLGWRPLPRTASPGAFEDLVQQKHRHVATDTIALSRNAGDGFNGCLPKPRLKRVELQHIGLCGEVRIPSAGADVPLHLNVGRRVISGILGIPTNEVLGVLDDPRVIRGYMVWYEIQ